MARSPEPEKRSALAAAAVEVLQREGTDVSMARLADALDVKRPTLLYHFATKADLVQHALVELLSEQAVYVLARMTAHEHPIDRLFAQMQAVHAFHHGREARIVFLTQAIAATAGERMSAILEAASHVFEEHRKAAVARIREGIAAGTVAPCDPDALFATCRALTEGLLVQRVMNGRELGSIHTLVWERLLAPLKLVPAEQRAPKGTARARGGSRRARAV